MFKVKKKKKKSIIKPNEVIGVVQGKEENTQVHGIGRTAVQHCHVIQSNLK